MRIKRRAFIRGIGYNFSFDETLDIGRDGATPVTADDPMGSEHAFNGQIYSVTVDIGPSPTVYYEPAENTWRRAMGIPIAAGTPAWACPAPLWPAVLLHDAMTAWGIILLARKPEQAPVTPQSRVTAEA